MVDDRDNKQENPSRDSDGEGGAATRRVPDLPPPAPDEPPEPGTDPLHEGP